MSARTTLTATATPSSLPDMPRLPRAVIFDAYGTLFDVHSVVAAAEQLFPGRGVALSRLWRRKQIEYTQLRTLADPAGTHYEPFWKITVDALRHAAARLALADALTHAAEKRLLDEYACLSTFPDIVPALTALRDRFNLPLAILSNGSAPMLDVAVKSAGMSGLFDHVLSVDAARAYPPAPAAYALGTRAFDAPPRDIVFVSGSGWNVAGATWFGYTSFWINRAALAAEELGVAPHGRGRGMADLVAFVEASAARPPERARSRTAVSVRRASPV
ncbi:haloacid dehalogenase type II [Caballeronia sp. LZ035]|uniref:haloacid dehalogenase type II n=1 Tax=Caballeronia sp. LZ035 TaxID=3038568 RepID=UPI0038D4067D